MDTFQLRKSFLGNQSQLAVLSKILILISSFVIYNFTLHFTKGEPDASLFNVAEAKGKAKVCICLADDRFSKADLNISRFQSLEDIKRDIREQAFNITNLNYWQMSALINQMYALEFDYDVIISDLSAYKDAFKDHPRKSVWLKPIFMLDMQHKRPDCTWFVAIDSDAYFWMLKHSVSLADWFSTSSLHEGSFAYHEFERIKRDRNGYYSWLEQNNVFLRIGLNGVFSSPQEGFPSTYGNRQHDFICAGVYFLKNCGRSKQFLKDWVYGPAESTDEEKSVMEKYAFKFSLEQRVLNFVLYPRYREGIYIYSFRDFGSKEGPMIRHVWHPIQEERAPRFLADLKILVEI
jgi:hypothetical protein